MGEIFQEEREIYVMHILRIEEKIRTHPKLMVHFRSLTALKSSPCPSIELNVLSVRLDDPCQFPQPPQISPPPLNFLSTSALPFSSRTIFFFKVSCHSFAVSEASSKLDSLHLVRFSNSIGWLLISSNFRLPFPIVTAQAQFTQWRTPLKISKN